MNNPPFRITMLTANVGAGHISIHKAIAEKLKETFKDQPVEISELEINSHLSLIGRFLLWIYALCAEWFPILYHLFYTRTNSIKTEKFIGSHRLLLSEKLRHKMGVLNPDLVINTHPSGGAICTLLKREGYVSPRCSFLMFDTDFATGSAYDSEGMLVVPHQKLKEIMLRDYYRPANSVEVIPGLLPRKVFCEDYSKDAARTKIHQEIKAETGIDYDINSPLFLAVGGGEGLRLKRLVNFLEFWTPTEPVVVPIICGKNRRLRHKIQAIINRGVHRNLTVIPLGFKKNIHEYMRAADILISKPGGATIAETMALGLPLFVQDFIEGQERLNLNFLVSLGVIHYLENMVELNMIPRILAAAQKIKTAQQREFPERRRAIERLPELFWKMLELYPHRTTALKHD